MTLSWRSDKSFLPDQVIWALAELPENETQFSFSYPFGLRAYNADSVKFYYNIIANCGKDDSNVTYRSGAIAFHSGAADTADTNIAYKNTI